MQTAAQRSDAGLLDLGDVLAADDLVGVLTREVRVRLVNISSSGCLVESSHRLEPGTSGVLRVRVGDDTFTDDVRIARVQAVQGAGAAWYVGAEFLWTTQPGVRSMRRMVSRLRQEAAPHRIEFEFASRRPM
jgi:PilZ domain